LGPQRKIGIRIGCAYRSVLIGAVLVVADTMPINLKVAKSRAVFQEKQAGLSPPSRQDLRAESFIKWQRA